MSDKTAKPEDGGQAFPRQGFGNEVYIWEPNDGMSLRDYFAAKAMASMIEDQRSPEYLSAFEGVESAHDSWVSSRAYEMADAMLKARAGR